MKKLFVSVPMKDRTEKEIKDSIAKMHKIAEAYEEEKLELIDTFIAEDAPEDCNQGIWYLYKSLEKLANADIFIGIRDAYRWRGCFIECETADRYGIKCYDVDSDIILDKAYLEEFYYERN